jgi:hypothetical protein
VKRIAHTTVAIRDAGTNPVDAARRLNRDETSPAYPTA